MEDPVEKKKALRRLLKERRASLGAGRRARMSAAIAAQVQKLTVWQSSGLLLCYVSFGDEVDTRGLLAETLRMGKRAAVPRCEGKRMTFYEIGSLDELKPGKYGIPEPPCDRPASPNPSSLCLVPGLSFDASGARIGYGGGYYDRFLADFSGKAVGLCFSPLFSEELLPAEPTDRRVPLVVTDESARWINKPE